MNTTTHFDPWHDRHTINMEVEQMNKFSKLSINTKYN